MVGVQQNGWALQNAAAEMRRDKAGACSPCYTARAFQRMEAAGRSWTRPRGSTHTPAVRCLVLCAIAGWCDALSAPLPSAARRVVSFDLDDTLWPIAEVVREANEAVQRRWSCLPAADVQGKMKELRKHAADGGRAMSYKAARTLAYQALLESGEEEAQEAFGTWLDARDRAAAKHLFDDAIPCLAGLTDSDQDPCLVAAITNGLSDPCCIPELAPFFTFTVSGEDPGIFPHRKPSRAIYQAAIDKARSLGWAGSLSDWWHVGDDRANDVEPAATLGMRTVLLEREDSFKPNPFSTLTREDQRARAAAATTQADLTLKQLGNLRSALGAFDAKARRRQRLVGIARLLVVLAAAVGAAVLVKSARAAAALGC